ncbi:MAG: DinB family protein [Candidatus Limnocylindria bacterium]
MYDSRKEILKALRAAPMVLRALCRGLTEADAGRRPAEGEWAVVEVVAHLADSDERARERVQRMLEEDDPHLPGYDQDELARTGRYIERDLAAELDRFQRVRSEHVALLASLDDAGWRRTGRHGEQGPMTVELYESHGAGEDADHMAQIARLISG